MSVDPGDPNLRKPQSWNRYSYAIGNPMKYVDPDGRKIDLANEHTAFSALVTDTLAQGERVHPRLAAMIGRLRGSRYVHAIREVVGPKSVTDPSYDPDQSNGVGSGSTIYLSMTTMGEGNLMTVLDALMHELSHSEDIDSGTVDESRSCETCPKSEEQKAVRMENLTGGQVRTTYGGQPVVNPTAVPPLPKPKTKKDKPGPDLENEKQR